MDVTASALSRQCDGWWGPDDLLEVERGARTLDDAAIVSLCHLYALPGRSLPPADALELVIDRIDSVELVGDGSPSVRSTAELGLTRLAAIGQLVGTDGAVPASTLDVLSTAFEMSVEEIQTTLDRMAGPARDVLDDVVGALADRVAVPTVGLLVAVTSSGSLVLTRRAGTRRRGSVDHLPAAGPLRWFTTVSATA
jgi:hypothetical protein